MTALLVDNNSLMLEGPGRFTSAALDRASPGI